MEVLSIMGRRSLFFCNQLLDRRLWGSHTSNLLADVGSRRKCHGCSDVRAVRKRFVCYSHPARSARRALPSAITAPTYSTRSAAGGVYVSMIEKMLFPGDFSPSCIAIANHVKELQQYLALASR